LESRASPFTPETLRFLAELRDNNEREWFNANKARYESLVLDPALAFIESMYEPLQAVAPSFTAIPKRSGGSLMRVYRDTRFSRDKTPYKTNIGIQFRHELGKDAHAPGYYLHIEPEHAFIGAGLWRPPAEPLLAIRRRIADRSAEWQRAVGDKRFRRRYALGGQSLKRPPRGFDKAHSLIEDIKRKDYIAIRELDVAEVTAEGFRSKMLDSIEAAEPLMRFLCTAVGAPFDASP
jgi:uncharacterized protein (TIGR02453 family)